jgi:hypothetical protein
MVAVRWRMGRRRELIAVRQEEGSSGSIIFMVEECNSETKM